MTYKLTPEAVEELFRKCLSDVAPIVNGIVNSAHLNTCGHEEEIKGLLMELPENFHRTKGGGWSFLESCNRQDGTQWTGLHEKMEKLFMLGIASGQAKCLLPHDMWVIFPGGMPYYSIF